MKLKETTKYKQNGFTIAELVVSTVVVAILVIGINSIYLTHMAQSQRARNLILVNSFVENKIETLRSAGFLSIQDETINITNELPGELKLPRSATLQISSAMSGLKNVLITITYSDNGTPQTYSYQTYIGELGVGQY